MSRFAFVENVEMVRQRHRASLHDLHLLVVTHRDIHRPLKRVVKTIDQLKLVVTMRVQLTCEDLSNCLPAGFKRRISA